MTSRSRTGFALCAIVAGCLNGGCGREPAPQNATRGSVPADTGRPSPPVPVTAPDRLIAQMLALDTAARFWPDVGSAVSASENPGFELSNGANVVASYEICPVRTQGDTAFVAVNYGVLGTAIRSETDGSWSFSPAPKWQVAVYRVVQGQVFAPAGEIAHLSASATVARSKGVNRDTLRAAIATAGHELQALSPPVRCDEQPN